MKRILTVLSLLLCISLGMAAQETFTLTGTVTDEKGEPLIGVSVIVSDVPGLGVTTDADGHYKLNNVSEFNKVEFTYIGFDKIVRTVGKKRVINVKMKESDDQMIDEVVVTGTGLKKKLNVTGAVTNVDVEELKSNPTGSISNALAGVVPGIQAMATSGRPGSVSEFWVRSISTFGANTSALVLVDGFERNLDEINVEDIESFTVLKDASETAIYGSKGANGVLLITTKHGHDGKINISGKVEGFYNQLTKVPEFVDGYTYASMANEARITRNQEPLYSATELEMFRLGIDPDLYPSVNWEDVMLRDGAFSERASLNLNGGGKTARYFVSGSYINQQGIYRVDDTMKDYNTNTNYRKWNYRANLDINATKSTLVSVGFSGSLAKQNDPGNGTSAIWNAIMGYNPVMVPVEYSNGYMPAWGDGNDHDGFNPWISATQTGYNESWVNNSQVTLNIDQKLDFITKGLHFYFRFGYDTYNSNWIKRRKWPAQYKATPRFRYPNGELQFTRIAEEQQMTQSSGSSGSRNEFLEWQLDYDRTFKGQHHVGLVFKYTQQSKVQTQNISDIKDGIARRNQGIAGRVEYDWKHRYYANFNFGYTGSENFAKDHRFGFFPAASFAWNILEEPVLKKALPWIEMFKVRYSIGKTGNDNLGSDRFPYLYTLSTTSGNAYQFGDYNYERAYSGIYYSTVASTDVTWEIAKKQDLGIDFSFFQDELSGTIDYYYEHRTGIYMSRNYLSWMTGLDGNAPKGNVGEVEARGFDGNIAWKRNFGRVNLTLRGNMTYSKNKILERDEPSTIYTYSLYAGHRVNQAFGLVALGLFKDYDDIRNSPKQTFGDYEPGDIKYKDINGDGVIDSNDICAIGATTRPNLTYGFGVSVKYGGLDFNVHFQGAGKSTYFINGSTVYMFSTADGWGNIMKDMANGSRWISREISGTAATENPNAEYPRLSYGTSDMTAGAGNNYRASTFWLRDGSYMRLKTLDIGYTFPKSLVRKIYVSNVRVFFVGTNLLTWSKFKLWDPEMGSSNGKNYPLSRTYSLGVSFNL